MRQQLKRAQFCRKRHELNRIFSMSFRIDATAALLPLRRLKEKFDLLRRCANGVPPVHAQSPYHRTAYVQRLRRQH